MVVGQRNNPIEALPPEGPDESFAERIRLRAPHGCCDDLKAEVRERLIESGGEDCVVVMEDKPVGVVRRYGFAQLLEGPGGSWMRRHVKVNKPARSVLHDHQHVKQPESRARDDAEVTGDDGRRVILQKGGPSLIAAPAAGRSGWYLGQILADRARRHVQA